ncbi:MAG: hypothetical protein A2173_03815 [Planctomycetes bacterium RBG_13_44_8b]|nr:MAG: hypothetical protein A2173_03815 [Planctomycetes bacterium RBG_13_44_8b]
MSGKGCKRNLPDKPGGKVPGRGTVKKIRTIVPKPGQYIHVRVMSKEGPRGGKTIASGVQTKKKNK